MGGQLREAQCAYEEASRVRQEISEKAGLAERRANALGGEMEEARALLESAVHTMHAEIDDMLHSAKNSEEKAKKAMVDAARLADELRAEQDHTDQQSKGKRALEAQLGEMEMRLAEASDSAVRGGRAAMAKLKGHQKAERKVKELAFQGDEDRKNQDRMSELATKLQAKIKTYKKQIEEAEEIAALNLAKFRKAQQELEETEERAKMAEGQLSVIRQSRGGSVY